MGYERKKKVKSNEVEIAQTNQVQWNKIEDQPISSKSQDYNNLVNEFIFVCQNVQEDLTDDERYMYDKVRDELMSEDVDYQKLTGVDRLLYWSTRISIIVNRVKGMPNDQIMDKNVTTN